MVLIRALTVCIFLCAAAPAAPASEPGGGKALLALLDLESFSSPRISPDGFRLVYTQWRVDWMTDRRIGETWLADLAKNSRHSLGEAREARWSTSGNQLAYFAVQPDGSTGLLVASPASARESRVLLSVPGYPRDLEWSPDGRLISFRMAVPAADAGWPIDLPEAPQGAHWAPAPRVIKRLHYRLDGLGYYNTVYEHLFLVDVESGEWRQLTQGNWHVGAKPAGLDMATSTSWSADSARIYFDGVAEADYESVYGLSNLYSVDVASGAVTRLELPRGFWINPTASPEGGLLAFAGFEHGEKTQTYTARELWVSRSDGSGLKKISADLDRDAETLQWSPDASGVYFSSDDNGSRQVFFASLESEVRQITHGNHAVYLGNFDRNGVAVASLSLPDQPPAIVSFSLSDFQGFERQTRPDPRKLAKAPIGEIEELRFESADGTALQGWLLKPPEFDASLKYPVILEIHGGPHEMYHWGWSTYFQGLAAQGFLVLYTNPRGSSGYGTPFGNAIDNDFPGEKDLADLMAAVEAVSAFPYADSSRLFVTGCSAGGTLTLWLIAHTQRFSAAAANCVISDFLAYAGTADVTDWSLHRFEERPWDNPSAWLEHSPLMMAGQIRTPTLLMGGEQDLRTPIAQAEQMFAALLVQGVPTRLVRFPTEGHGTTRAPSNLMRTILYISDWFMQWSRDGAGQASETNGRTEGSARE